jgi:hypothetical protein
LHDLSKTSLSDNLEKLEVVNRQSVLSHFNKVYADLHLTSAKLNIDPVSTSLTSCCVLPLLILAVPLLLKARVDSQSSNEDILVSASVRRSGRVANVEGNIEISHSGNIELVLCVAASPQWVLWCTGNGIDEDLLLVEIDQGIWQMFRGVSTVDSGCCVDAASSGLWAPLTSVRANNGVPRRSRSHRSRYGEATASRK